MNLSDLRYLVALADHRHFGRAAEASFVSQPTLSTQLKKLERELGVELIERSPRHVMLTPVGELVVERARLALREADGIREIARHARNPEAATLRLGIFPTLGPYLLPHVVPLIRSQLPQLELLLTEEKTETVLGRLRDGTLDVGILALPVDDDHLHHELLFDEEFVLAVPDGHPLADREAVIDLSALSGEQLLLLEDGHCLRHQALSVCQLSGAAERSGFRATSLETLRQMVAARVGITLLPRLAVEPPVPAFDGVHLVRFADPAPRRRVAMFWRTTSPYRDFLPRLAELVRRVPTAAVSPVG